MAIDYDDVERTELVWPGKRTEVQRVVLPFQTVETLSEPRMEQRRLDTEDWPENYPSNWRNRLIWGDNKYVMSSLLPEFEGQIDLIYIDPPFATGADFSLNIEVGEGLEVTKEASVIEELAYRDTWGKGLQSYLQMLYGRLVLMRELLSSHGSLVVHIDYRVTGHLRLLLDEVFCPELMQNEIIWNKGFRGTPSKRIFQHAHETLWWYSSSDSYHWNQTFEPYKDEDMSRYNQTDDEGNRYALIKRRRTDGTVYYGRTYPGEEGKRRNDVISDIPTMAATSSERIGYETQKPMDLLKVVINALSDNGDLVADFFCGSGTTGAVAEKLGRRWIMADLSKYAIHIARKRLLNLHNDKDYDKPCRPFVIQNLGSYQKHKFIENDHPPVKEYQQFILELYEAQPLEGYAFLQGRKGRRFVHIAGIDSIVTAREVEDTAQECKNAAGGESLDILGWDFELGLDQQVEDIEEMYGLDITPKLIPREAAELKDIAEAGEHIRFFDLNYLELAHKTDGRRLEIELADFMLANPEYVPQEVREQVQGFADYIDYWAVDFDYQDDTFHNGWQSFRTRQDRSLDTRCIHHYDDDGPRTVLVKVIDIFGNDTNQAFEVNIGG